jgi:2-polyprenyl-3-methyl-5-hydroxy-6-metoxy-1,4-benzoquinol methylase
MISDELRAEASAFDSRILERVQNGLVPDLQKAANVDWFYNNPWRRREYINMVFGDYLRFAKRHLPKSPARILEIGSGLGHMSLELARAGHRVTGLELSPESVRIAQEYYSQLNKEDRGSGSVEYVNADFQDWKTAEPFDAVCFFLTLHHFEKPDAVIDHVRRLLKPSGTIVVVEPARDLFSKRDAAVVALVRTLLTFQGNWYENRSAPKSTDDLSRYVGEIWDEYREAKESNEAEQSPHDNSTFANAMLVALRKYFDETELTHGNTLTPRLLGGVRGKSEEQALAIATFLKLFDDYSTREGILEPGVIYFAGRLK